MKANDWNTYLSGIETLRSDKTKYDYNDYDQIYPGSPILKSPDPIISTDDVGNFVINSEALCFLHCGSALYSS